MNWKSIHGETPIDIPGLKISGITDRRELSVVEAENIRKTIVKYLGGSLLITRRTARFDLSWMLKLHREMFGNVWVWAGETRTTNLNIGAPWHRVTTRMQDLCDDLDYWQKNWPDFIQQAAHLHHRAVLILHFSTGMVAGHVCLRISGCSSINSLSRNGQNKLLVKRASFGISISTLSVPQTRAITHC